MNSMRSEAFIIVIIAVVFLSIIGNSSFVFAQTSNTPAQSEIAIADGNKIVSAITGSDMDESEKIEAVFGQYALALGNPGKDPFKPLVEKKIHLPILPKIEKKEEQKPVVVQLPIEPLKMSVKGICGNEGERLALIIFENKPIVVQRNMIVDGKFKVMDILNDKISVYSNREQSRKSFALSAN